MLRAELPINSYRYQAISIYLYMHIENMYIYIYIYIYAELPINSYRRVLATEHRSYLYVYIYAYMHTCTCTYTCTYEPLSGGRVMLRAELLTNSYRYYTCIYFHLSSYLYVYIDR